MMSAWKELCLVGVAFARHQFMACAFYDLTNTFDGNFGKRFFCGNEDFHNKGCFDSK